jgi:DNA-binding transcriptional regulator YhcF (GntR family)
MPAPLSTVNCTFTNVAALGDTEHVTELGDWVRVDPDADRPLFDQLRIQIIDGIRDGRLSPGTRLPTVRELAGQIGLAVNTVARAYRELEAAGVLETRGRYGTFVARADPADAAMAAAANSFAEAARALGIGKVDALRYLDTAFD